METFVGWVVGLITGAFVSGWITTNDFYTELERQEEDCRKEYNVYQCERVYVPKDISDGS